MEAFFLSLALVSLAEIGDRSQLLALFLAAHYRRPWPILAAITLACLIIHSISTLLGVSVGMLLDQRIVTAAVGLLFIGMGVLVLIPASESYNFESRARGRNVFATTFLAFLLMEIGDKTQLTSMALAARFDAVVPIILGATLAMVLITIPVVLLGNHFADRIPVRLTRRLAAVMFIVVGIWMVMTA